MTEQQHRQKQGRQPRCFLSLVTGVLIGFALAVFVYLYAVVSNDPKVADAAQDLVKRISPAGSKAPSAEAEAAQTTKSSSSRFDFYEVLPSEESHSAEDYADVIPPADPAITPSVPPIVPEETPQPGTYMLQAASFKDFRIAEEFKASLALQGVPGVIQHAVVRGENWYRVRIGPFATLEEANRMQNLLRQNGFPDAMLVKF